MDFFHGCFILTFILAKIPIWYIYTHSNGVVLSSEFDDTNFFFSLCMDSIKARKYTHVRTVSNTHTHTRKQKHECFLCFVT